MSYLMSSYLPSFKNGKCWPRGYQLVTSATAEHFHFLEEPQWGLHKHEQMGGRMMTGLASVRLWEKASLFIIHAFLKSGGRWGQTSKQDFIWWKLRRKRHRDGHVGPISVVGNRNNINYTDTRTHIWGHVGPCPCKSVTFSMRFGLIDVILPPSRWRWYMDWIILNYHQSGILFLKKKKNKSSDFKPSSQLFLLLLNF